MSYFRSFLLGAFAIFIVFLSGCTALPPLLESIANRVVEKPPYSVSQEAQILHDELFIVDLHADPLFMGRDLTEEASYSHIDLPRLLKANVALQAFTVWTAGRYPASPDGWEVAGFFLRFFPDWPVESFHSLFERAKFQAGRLFDLEEKWNAMDNEWNRACHKNYPNIKTFRVIKNRIDLEKFLEDRKKCPHILAGYLGIEGAHAVDGKAENVKKLYDEGYRMMSLTHMFDNKLGGSSEGSRREGITELGRSVIDEMLDAKDAKGPWIIDLAHASPELMDDIAEITQKKAPKTIFVSSHTGVKGIIQDRVNCDYSRQIGDRHIRLIAKSGGVVSIGFGARFHCKSDVESIVNAIRHTIDAIDSANIPGVQGINHIGLGSDFDGGVKPPFDVTGLPKLTEALLKDGFTNAEIHKIMGGNSLRVLTEALPRK